MAATRIAAVLRHVREMAVAGEERRLHDRELLHRFARHRDERAFAQLVERHGGLVMGVCRRVLQHTQEAEDAFQATFLVLAKKAGSIRKGASLSSWLHGVARRTSL